MITLLGVNVLIALCDQGHPHRSAARKFFTSGIARTGWATCPLVETGFLRIFGRHNYPGGPGSPASARVVLQSLLATPGHQFWPDDLSLMDRLRFPDLPRSSEFTDFYLLVLAVKLRARFATLDAGIDASLAHGGREALVVVTDRRTEGGRSGHSDACFRR